MAYTTIDDPSAFFQTALYTGNAGTLNVVNDGNSDLQPSLVWLKQRNATGAGILFDSVRGATKFVRSSDNAAEVTVSDVVTAFNSDGFTLGADSADYSANQNNDTHVGWQWKAGTAFSNDASSTSVGTIDSVGSFNNDAGFSIVTYSGTGSAGTIKHGLNSVPKIILWKRRDNNAGAVNWIIQSTLFGNQTKLVLNTTEAFSTGSAFSQTDNWTNALIDLKTYEGQNASNGTYVALCFAEKKGYSKFGTYTGNGNADGTFVYTGFRPAFVMVKRTNGTGDFHMADNKRLGYNPDTNDLFANLSNAEDSGNFTEIYSNGFKFNNSEATHNGSGDNFIYMAFAEAPFVTSSGVPATAR